MTEHLASDCGPGIGALVLARASRVVRFVGAQHMWTVATVALCIGSGAWWLWVAHRTWERNQYHLYDLAVIDQLVWNTSQGRWFESSFFSYNFLGQHFQPVLGLYAVPYRAGAGAELLVLSQAVAAGISGLLVFAVARKLSIGPILSICIVAVFLLNPFLHRALEYDFHPETMVALPSFAAVLAALHDRRRCALLLGLAPMLFKEDAVFVTLAIAVLFSAFGLRKEATLLAVASIAWTAIVVLALMPAIRDGAPSDLVARYGYLYGTTVPAEVLRGVLTRPATVVRAIFSWHNALVIGAVLLGTSVAGMVRPALLLLLLPGLILALLSSHPEQRNLELHYAVELVPIASLITVVGAVGLARRLGAGATGAIVFGAGAAGFLVLSPLSPVAGSPLDDERVSVSASHMRTVQEAIAIVPPDSALSVQSGLAPRVSQRRTLGEFPPAGEPYEWVLVDSLAPRSEIGYDEALDAVRAEFDLRFSRDGVEVYQRRPASAQHQQEP